jgi:multidrug efflux system outer membrane protein
MRYRFIITVLLSAFMLQACSFAPKFEKPRMDLPANFDNRTSQSINIDWWKSFKDLTLNSLIEEALKNNDDLQLSAARIEEAQAYLGLQSANLYPTIGASAQQIRQKTSKEISPDKISSTYNTFSFAGLVSYELDLWGKLKNQKKAAISQLLAAEYNQETLRLTLISNVATAYFNLIAINKQLNVAKKSLKSYKETYIYRKKQYKYGQISKIVVYQAKAQYEGARILTEKLRNQKTLLMNSLSILLGKSPKEIFENSITFKERLPKPIKVPKAIPSSVLENRPDIQAALENLKSKNALIGAARAAYFPSISLTGILGFQSLELSNLIQSSAKFWNVKPQANMNIFDFERISSNVRLTKAQKKEAIIQYKKTIRNAFKEVFDALNTLKSDTAKLEAQQKEIETLKRVLDLSNKRFNVGYTNYLEVLKAQRSYLNARLNLEELKAKVLADQVTLYKALGKGWNPKF